MQVPLFPLNAVLFPGGPLPLRIFEPRYLTMVSDCVRNDTPFGVLLIREGAEAAMPREQRSGRAPSYRAGITRFCAASFGERIGLLLDHHKGNTPYMLTSSFAKLGQVMSRPARNRQAMLLLLSALLLRAGIPDGYMPSAPGDGLLFELCPAGVPAGFITALTGSDRHHHHNEADDSRLHFDAGQCPIGHLLSSTVAFDNPWQLDAIPELASFVAARVLTNTSRIPVSPRSRGPPA